MTHYRQLVKYRVIKELREEKNYPIEKLCQKLNVSRSCYYRWLTAPKSKNEKFNEDIAEKLKVIHDEDPSCGYRRLSDELYSRYDIEINDKRALRICRMIGLQSEIKWRPASCTRSANGPQQIRENILNRDFKANAPNEKWVTDVTEFKYYKGIEVHKIYLSAVLDLCDKRVVGFRISNRNDNELVESTFKICFEESPNMKGLIHTDRGYQYTSGMFAEMIDKHEMTHSMSRVGKCIDNGPIEGFWGILKREMYYNKKYFDREKLIEDIEGYIEYYNNKRVQRKLNRMSPANYSKKFKAA